jgi:DNA-binding MarR family transcriptional regulator
VSDARSSDRLAHLIKLVNRGFIRSLQLRLADKSVSIGHWIFLRILWEEDGLTQRELSQRSGLGEPTAFAALKAMEKLDYVRRQRSAEDLRKTKFHLSKRGKALEDELVPLAYEVNDVATAGIDRKHSAEIRKYLAVMLRNLEHDEERHRKQDKRVPPTRNVRRHATQRREASAPE